MRTEGWWGQQLMQPLFKRRWECTLTSSFLNAHLSTAPEGRLRLLHLDGAPLSKIKSLLYGGAPQVKALLWLPHFRIPLSRAILLSTRDLLPQMGLSPLHLRHG